MKTDAQLKDDVARELDIQLEPGNTRSDTEIAVAAESALNVSITPATVATRIREALTRHAEREANHMEVLVTGSTVTLRGEVDSLAERAVAFNAAWAAPGISVIVNEITVRY